MKNRLLNFMVPMVLMAFPLLSCTETKPTAEVDPKSGGDELPVIEQILNRLKETEQRGNLTGAVVQGDLDKVRRLLRAGANVNEDIGNGANSITPLMAAVILSRDAIGVELLNFGARVDARYQGYSIREFANEVLTDGMQLRKGVMQR